MDQNRDPEKEVSVSRPDESVSTGGARDEEQQIASGRPSTTPFAVTGIVAMAIWGTAALVVGVVFLVFWLSS
jgi:hypothetical protein